jgi:hypothetical protein
MSSNKRASKRRCARNHVFASEEHINAQHFLGYCGDNESVELIMSKFAALEELEQSLAVDGEKENDVDNGSTSGSNSSSSSSISSSSSASKQSMKDDDDNNNALPEHLLADLALRTTCFDVDEAMGRTHKKAKALSMATYDDADSDDDFWNFGRKKRRNRRSSSSLSSVVSDVKGPRGRPKGSTRPSAKKSAREAAAKYGRKPRQSVAPSSRKRQRSERAVHIAMRNGQKLAVRRKIRDPNAVAYVRIPDTIPTSWALPIRDVVPSQSQSAAAGCVYVEGSVLDFDLSTLGSFDALLVNPPWHAPDRADTDEGGAGNAGELMGPTDLLRLRLDERVVFHGFVFMWVEKSYIADVVRVMSSLDFRYIETIHVLRKLPNNKLVQRRSCYFSNSKDTMVVFRKFHKVYHFELRHQRSPDVCTEFVHAAADGRSARPEFIYKVIETLLPTGRIGVPESVNRGRFLQLWAPAGSQRAGWTMLVHKPIEHGGLVKVEHTRQN